MELILDIVQIALGLACLVAILLKHGPSKRARKRAELARLAVDYAEQMGGSGAEKLAHALGAAKRLDQVDGKLDFTDAELRIAIEATIGGWK